MRAAQTQGGNVGETEDAPFQPRCFDHLLTRDFMGGVVVCSLNRIRYFTQWRLVLCMSKDIEAGREQKPGRSGLAASGCQQIACAANVDSMSKVGLLLAVGWKHIGQVDDEILILYCLQHVCGLPNIALDEFDFASIAPGGT